MIYGSHKANIIQSLNKANKSRLCIFIYNIFQNHLQGNFVKIMIDSSNKAKHIPHSPKQAKQSSNKAKHNVMALIISIRQIY